MELPIVGAPTSSFVCVVACTRSACSGVHTAQMHAASSTPKTSDERCSIRNGVYLSRYNALSIAAPHVALVIAEVGFRVQRPAVTAVATADETVGRKSPERCSKSCARQGSVQAIETRRLRHPAVVNLLVSRSSVQSQLLASFAALCALPCCSLPPSSPLLSMVGISLISCIVHLCVAIVRSSSSTVCHRSRIIVRNSVSILHRDKPVTGLFRLPWFHDSAEAGVTTGQQCDRSWTGGLMRRVWWALPGRIQ
jgi:hypothetical protein